MDIVFSHAEFNSQEHFEDHQLVSLVEVFIRLKHSLNLII
jgi:hypothetical protein